MRALLVLGSWVGIALFATVVYKTGVAPLTMTEWSGT